MKLSCTRDNLHQALAITSHLTTKNVNLPILQNVLMKAEGGSIRFTATNLEIAINCSVRGKVDTSGEFTIPSKLFFDYVSLLPNETIQLEVIDEVLHVSCGPHKTKINGLDASEFPLVPKVDTSSVHQIPVDDFKRALARVLFSVASNESRPELTGVSMQFSPGTEGRLTLAATDSYRLAECVIPVVSPVSEEQKLIVPAKTLSEICRILSVFKDVVDCPTSVEMGVSDSQVVFTYGSVEIISRTIEGNYPDYKQIIPKSFQTETMLDRADFGKAVKTASLFSRTGLFDVTLELDPSDKQLRVKALDTNRGENTAVCGADISGQKNTVTVNYRYLLDGLNAMDTDEVFFQMIDPANPCLVTPKDKSMQYLYIVMPIKQ
jgi:DNA polymerase III subunit beta